MTGLNIHAETLVAVFALSVALGALNARTGFCTMGAVSDWMALGDLGRMRAWVLAMAVAMAGLTALESAAIVDLATTFPPYRSVRLAWLRHLAGGLLFGIGMTLASGCGNRTLVRIGGGNLKSVFVLAVCALFAYLMNYTGFNTRLFGWMNDYALALDRHGIADQSLGALATGLFGGDAKAVNVRLGMGISALLALWALASTSFRHNIDQLASGIGVGLAVVAGWWLTAGPRAAAWKEWADFSERIPSRVEAQSFTFIAPMGDGIRYLADPLDTSLINFGLMALAGVIAGSFVWNIASGRFRIEVFAGKADLIRHAIGAAFMAVGGVLALGCSVGQGITGLSTLALGSFLTLAAIIAGSALTMKAAMWWLMRD